MSSKRLAFGDHPGLAPVGQGTWDMGEVEHRRAGEIAALRAGIEAGMTLIDTAEMYASGGAERVVGEAIRGLRDRVYLVSKAYPWHGAGDLMLRACEESLQRLGTDYLDLYLLHWRGEFSLAETVETLETLVAQGKIRRWGVSNFDHDDMLALWQVDGGRACATNQVLYHLASRGIEYDLLPWCQQQNLPVMAYSPLAQAGRLRNGLFNDGGLRALAAEKGISVAQLLLAWVIDHRGVMAIPKAATVEHVQQNARVMELVFTQEEREIMDQCFPAPGRKMPLDMV